MILMDTRLINLFHFLFYGGKNVNRMEPDIDIWDVPKNVHFVFSYLLTCYVKGNQKKVYKTEEE